MYVCACPKSGACNLVVVICCCVIYLLVHCFVHKQGCEFYRLNCFTFVISRPFIADYAVWLCSLLKAVQWPTVVNFCDILVSCENLSHWQSYHILFFYIIFLITPLYFVWCNVVALINNYSVNLIRSTHLLVTHSSYKITMNIINKMLMSISYLWIQDRLCT